MRCDECKFCINERVEGAIKKQNVCKRFPPSSQLVATPHGAQIVTISPVVLAENYCGEFKPIEPQIKLMQ